MVQTTAKAINSASQSTLRNSGGTGPRFGGEGGPGGALAADFSTGFSGVVFFGVVFCVFTKIVLSRFCLSSQAHGLFTSTACRARRRSKRLTYTPIDTEGTGFVWKKEASGRKFLG